MVRNGQRPASAKSPSSGFGSGIAAGITQLLQPTGNATATGDTGAATQPLPTGPQPDAAAPLTPRGAAFEPLLGAADARRPVAPGLTDLTDDILKDAAAAPSACGELASRRNQILSVAGELQTKHDALTDGIDILAGAVDELDREDLKVRFYNTLVHLNAAGVAAKTALAAYLASTGVALTELGATATAVARLRTLARTQTFVEGLKTARDLTEPSPEILATVVEENERIRRAAEAAREALPPSLSRLDPYLKDMSAAADRMKRYAPMAQFADAVLGITEAIELEREVLSVKQRTAGLRAELGDMRLKQNRIAQQLNQARNTLQRLQLCGGNPPLRLP
jgi:hypothetical protein